MFGFGDGKINLRSFVFTIDELQAVRPAMPDFTTKVAFYRFRDSNREWASNGESQVKPPSGLKNIAQTLGNDADLQTDILEYRKQANPPPSLEPTNLRVILRALKNKVGLTQQQLLDAKAELENES